MFLSAKIGEENFRALRNEIFNAYVFPSRFIPGDVEALLESQNRLSKVVKGFKYNLGFSGGYFHNGSPEENSADDLILKKR